MELSNSVLVRLVDHLSYDDVRVFRQLAKKYHYAEKTARYSVKQMSIGRVRKKFHNLTQKKGKRHGILHIGQELKKHLRDTPGRVLREVDVSGISYPQGGQVERVLQDLDAQSLFARVVKLNLADCVLDMEDLRTYARIMPLVWSIRLSLHCLLLRENEIDFEAIPTERKKEVEVTLRQNGIEHYSLGEERLHLVKMVVFHLTLLFPRLEAIQLDVATVFSP